jgi:hypothetical protein
MNFLTSNKRVSFRNFFRVTLVALFVFEAYDLSGNAWTWTLSLYQNYPYDADDGRENTEAEGSRVLRGGSWLFNNVRARAACRNRDHPAFRNYSLGFRLLMLRPTPFVPLPGPAARASGRAAAF